MPSGYVVVDSRTVRGPDARAHDVLEAIEALPWRAQLCPFMRHEYSIRGKGPAWAWDVVSTMLQAKNPDSFRAYFRGYPSANRYWDAPDGRRYWGGGREIDRGEADDLGHRRVDEGGRPAKDWQGPRHAPNGIGLYEQDSKNRWWPTPAALEAGFLPCAACARPRKALIVAVPSDPAAVLALITAAQEDSMRRLGRRLDRDELGLALRQFPEEGGPVSRISPLAREPAPASAAAPASARSTLSPEIQGVIVRLLDMREAEAPLGHAGYRGPFTQKVIARIAGVPVKTVTAMAIERDGRRSTDEPSGRA